MLSMCLTEHVWGSHVSCWLLRWSRG